MINVLQMFTLKFGKSMIATKHKQITRILKENIASRVYSDRLPPVRQLAEDFNVSTRTISKALKPLVGKGMVISKGAEGCYVNHRRAVRPQTGIVGLLVNFDWTRLERDPLLASLQQAIERDGYKLIFSNVDASQFTDMEFWRSNYVDGYIFVYSSFDLHLANELKSLGIPFVVGNRLPESFGAPWVDFDHLPALRFVVGKLLEAGYQRLALHNLPNFSKHIDYIVQIWKETMNYYGVPRKNRYEVFGLCDGESPELTVERHVDRWLASKEPPEVVISWNSRTSLLVKALEKRNISVPEDILLLSIRDDDSSAVSVDLKLPYASLGKKIWELFKQELEGGD
jgi:DNA-binding LacI/PurR family transcriptional regulator